VITAPFALELQREQDVVVARQRARQIAAFVGFDAREQTRIATAVSEVARNAFQYAGGGRVEFGVEGERPQMLAVRIVDEGPGIANLQEVLDGRSHDMTGAGIGLAGARRLTDRFEVRTAPGRGTSVSLARALPPGARAVTPADLARLSEQLAGEQPRDAFEEVRQVNQELVRALEELRLRQEEIDRLNRELEDTNRGVVALYAELDERAGYLERLSELKTRFLSHLSHELRTPLNAVRNLTRLLLDGFEGTLTEQQQRPVRLIRASMDELVTLVDDLLDLAKIEAGKTVVRAEEFSAADLMAALRGMFRALHGSERVTLVFDDVSALPPLVTDEGKVAQILRNFVSNAVKFTEEGEIRVSATAEQDDMVRFTVRDSGIGIAPADQERIFEEFSQVEHPMQRRVKGTGLGLPLSRQLARLLGGDVSVRSTEGEGSEFTLVLPRVYQPVSAPAAAFDAAVEAARHG
jgi:signal transduction histidine kinase